MAPPPRRALPPADPSPDPSPWQYGDPAPACARRALTPIDDGPAADLPARLVDSVPPPPVSWVPRDRQSPLPASQPSGRRYAQPHDAPLPRRSATSPSQWADEVVLPRRSASSPSEWDREADPRPRRSATSPSEWDREADPRPRRSATSPSERDREADPRPRRSATSPSQWDSPDDLPRTLLEPPSPRPTPAAAAAVVETPPPRRSWPWLALALLLTLAIVAAWYALQPRGESDNPGVHPVPTAVAFAAPEQLTGLGAGWKVVRDEGNVTDASAQATCLVGGTTRLPRATASSLRLLESSSGSLLHRIDTYADRRVAVDAFAARRAQLATCGAPMLITGASTALGLGDDAVVLQVSDQAATPTSHTVLLLQVGSGVEILDLGQRGRAPDPVGLTEVAKALVRAHCGPLQGTCSVSAVVTAAVPPAGGEPGFLLPADLPRVTPGVGDWIATAPQPRIDLPGTSCEPLRLADVAAQRRFQRTLILTRDPNAGTAFGIDEVVLQLASPQEAAELARRLTDGLTGCPSRLPTATVSNVVPVEGVTDSGPLQGTSLRIVQQPAGTVAVYRASVVVVGARVVYLVETPRETHDLTDEQWLAVVVRAGQRAAQWP